MSNRSNRNPKKIASTKFETKKQKQARSVVNFNITKMAYNYMIAKRALAMFSQKSMQDSATFFSGVLRGYDDWWAEAGIDQDKFNELQSKLDLKQNAIDARELVDNIIKAKTPLVHMPGQTLTGVEEKATKEIFDRQLKGAKK